MSTTPTATDRSPCPPGFSLRIIASQAAVGDRPPASSRRLSAVGLEESRQDAAAQDLARGVAAVGVEPVAHDRLAVDHDVAHQREDRAVHRREVDEGVAHRRADRDDALVGGDDPHGVAPVLIRCEIQTLRTSRPTIANRSYKMARWPIPSSPARPTSPTRASASRSSTARSRPAQPWRSTSSPPSWASASRRCARPYDDSAARGWIRLDTHRNARVAELDLHEARQLLEARRALEPAAVALAAERRTDADVVRMQAALKRLKPVTRKWGESALAAHREVHRALYSASHNDVVVRMLDDLWDKSDRYRRVGLQLPPGGGAPHPRLRGAPRARPARGRR